MNSRTQGRSGRGRWLVAVGMVVVLGLVGAGLYVGTLLGGGVDAEALLATSRTNQEAGEHREAVINLRTLLQSEPEHAEGRWLLSRSLLELRDGAGALKEVRRAQELGTDGPAVREVELQAMLMTGEAEAVMTRLGEIDAGEFNANLHRLRGDAALALDELSQAARSYREAVRLGPDDWQTHFGLANAMFRIHDYLSSGQALDRAIALNEAEGSLWKLKGELAMVTTEYEAAEAAFLRAVAASPDDLNANLGLARARQAVGEAEAAAETLEAINQKVPGHPRVAFWTGKVAEARGDVEAARDAYMLVIAERPGHLETLSALAWLHFNEAQYEEAKPFAESLVTAAPDHLPSRALLAAVHITLGDATRTIETLEPVVERNIIDVSVALLLADAYAMLGEWDRSDEFRKLAETLGPASTAVERRIARSAIRQRSEAEAVELLGQRPVDPRSAAVLVVAHLSAGELEEAGELVTAMLATNADNPTAHALQGAVDETAGRLDAARQSYERALVLQPKTTRASLGLARLSIRAGQAAEAARHYERALEVSPGELTALLGLARLALNAGDAAAAREHLARAREDNPRAPEPLVGLAELALADGRTEEARQLAQRAERLAPESQHAAIVLGRVHLAEGQVDKAENAFLLLTSRDDASADAWFYRGESARAAGNAEAAATAYRRAIEVDAALVAAKSALARLAVRGGDIAGALEWAAQVRADRPQAADGFLLEGEIHRHAGNMARAVAALERAHALAPSGRTLVALDAAQRVGADSARLGDLDARLVAWAETHPNDWPVARQLAIGYHQRGDVAAAASQYERVLELSPASAGWVNNNLAWLHLESEPARALGHAKAAFDLSPHDPDVVDTYGWVLHENGKHEQARTVLERFARDPASKPQYRYRLAVARLSTGDIDGAVGLLQQVMESPAEFAGREHARQILARLSP